MLLFFYVNQSFLPLFLAVVLLFRKTASLRFFVQGTVKKLSLSMVLSDWPGENRAKFGSSEQKT